jgi:ATP-dependent DNA helicase RecG
MLVSKGGSEDLRPVNAGLLFFSKQPDHFFPRTWIELVVHKDDNGSGFTEHYFKGPLHIQLRDALSFLKTNIIHEQVHKVPHQAEAIRYYNFPYEALEEVLSNAVYHKSYEVGKPIEVQVWPSKIEVLSYPGPIPPVDAQILSHQRRIVARDYRNRRIGDLLKELDLTEGRGTGFPTIYKAMDRNGSPKPQFDTDEQGTYFLAILPAHDDLAHQVTNGANTLFFNNLSEIIAFSNGAANGAANGADQSAISIISNEIHDRVSEILEILLERMKRSEFFDRMKLSNQSRNREKYLDPLIESGWVSQEYPGEKTHPNQTYQITEAGRRILQLINNG